MEVHRIGIGNLLSKTPILSLLFVLVLSACATQAVPFSPSATPFLEAQPSPPSATPFLETQPSPPVGKATSRTGKRLAAEFQGNGRWINSEPITLESQRGKVVLIDFWTYSCINCIRTLPFLKQWDLKYRDKGLVIVGVHTPEFRFEKNFDNVTRAVAAEAITWAVVQDNDRETWDAYNNRFWPSKYLIDQHGVMRHFYGGEGGYNLTEGRIRALLEETGADLSDIDFVSAFDSTSASIVDPNYDVSVESLGYRPPDKSGLEETYDPSFTAIQNADVTSELLLGYEGGCRKSLFSNSKVADSLYCNSKDIETSYQDSREREDHRLYIQGQWLVDAETLRHLGPVNGLKEYLLLRFASKSVNLVADSEQGHAKVLVTLDGEPLTEANRGEDVLIEDDGRSFLVLDGPRLYGVLELPAYGVHEIKLSPVSEGFVAYSFTFGIYADGP